MHRLRVAFVLFLVIGSVVAASQLLPRNAFAAETSFTFAAAGDFNTHPDPDSTGPVLDRLSASGVSFLLALGDLGYTEDEQGWCTWAKSRFNNILVIAGNHDSDESGPGDISSTRVYCSFTMSSQGVTLSGAPGTPADGYGYAYYFDYPSAAPLARFILVPFGNSGCVSEQASFCFTNLNWAAPGSPQRIWFENAVTSAKLQGLWTFVGMHEDCISSAMRGCDTGQTEFDLMIQLGVDVILYAHNHVYDRSKQLALGATCPTVISDLPGDINCVVDSDNSYLRGIGTVAVSQGTGGAGLYDVVCDSIYFMASMSDVTACGGTGTGAGGRGAVKYTVTPTSITAQTDFDSAYSDLWTIGGTIGPQPLRASFTFQPIQPEPGTTITFTAVVLGGTSPYSYTWNFGDGATATGPVVTHAYSAEGTYTTSLTAIDADSNSATTQRSVPVQPTGSGSILTVTLTVSPTSPNQGANVIFTAEASGGTAPYTYDWDLGDGARITGASVTHSYARGGSYAVTLTAIDDTGQTITSARTISVAATGSPPPPFFLPPSLQLDESSLWLFIIGAMLGLVLILAALNLRTRSRINYARRLIER